MKRILVCLATGMLITTLIFAQEKEVAVPEVHMYHLQAIDAKMAATRAQQQNLQLQFELLGKDLLQLEAEQQTTLNNVYTSLKLNKSEWSITGDRSKLTRLEKPNATP